MSDFAISDDFIKKENAARNGTLEEDYAALTRSLGRRGLDVEALVR
jgi:L-rhamnose isomerase